MFLAGANLGRPSSSMCISVSWSPLELGRMGVASDATASGASSRNSSSLSGLSLAYYPGGVRTADILLLGRGTFTASTSSSG